MTNYTKPLIGVVLIGSVLIIGLFSTGTLDSLLNSQSSPDDTDNPSNIPATTDLSGQLGEIIAKQMDSQYNDIAYIWLFNNTFTNLELTSHFTQYIDGLMVNNVNGTLQMALIHEPNATLKPITNQSLSNTLGGFSSVISDLNQTADTSLDSVFPPTFMIDIAYTDHSSISLYYSEEKQILGIVNGTWTIAEGSTLYGMPLIEIVYGSQEFVNFQLDVTQTESVNSAIENFKTLIFETFA